MCGFFISNSSLVSTGSAALIEKCLRFRGPDGSSGLVHHNNWFAYHSRLSIIDVNSGVNQPFIDRSNGLLVFNGEILNYKELGRKYFDREYQSDTHLLSDLIVSDHYQAAELDGFFAFVYIDGNGELLHACRDTFGVKPLFVYRGADGSLSFSSEPNILKALFNLQANPNAIEEYYAVRSPIFSGSYFFGVDSVAPATCFVNGPYRDLNKEILEKRQGHNLANRDDYLTQTEAAIRKGIDTRMVSDVPVALLLSRGIDSHLIKALSPIANYYSIGFAGDGDYDYLSQQNIEGLYLHSSTPDEYRADFEYLLNLRMEPMSVPNEVLLYRISKIAAQNGVKVLLSGEGADEFFGGYDRVFRWASEQNYFDLDQFLDHYCYKTPAKDSLVYQKFVAVFEAMESESPFDKVRCFFITYHMPVLFRRLDFALMAGGVEGREPIANNHVFSIAIQASSEMLMNADLGKLPLREIASKYFGSEFAYEKKIGFPVDLTKIFENPEDLSSYELWFEKNLEVLK